MKLKSIIVSNYGIFYGINTINVKDGITMITGSVGSGKTSLVNAFQWAISRYSTKQLWPIVCRTRFDELEIGQQDYVKVILYYSTSEDFIFEKSMSFSKDEIGRLILGNITTTLSSQSGILHGQEAVYKLSEDFPMRQFHAISMSDVEMPDVIKFSLMDLKSAFESYLYFTEKSALRAGFIKQRDKEHNGEQSVKIETFYTILNSSFKKVFHDSVLQYLNLIQEKANMIFKLIAREQKEWCLQLNFQDFERVNYILTSPTSTAIKTPNIELCKFAEFSIIMAVFEFVAEQNKSHLPILLDISCFSVIFKNNIDCILATIKERNIQVIIITYDLVGCHSASEFSLFDVDYKINTVAGKTRSMITETGL